MHLILNIENADRSAASQIALLLPICESAIRVREFIKVYSRYEYGKVSHALVAGMKGILREFDLLIAQVEDELIFNILNKSYYLFGFLFYFSQSSWKC